MGDIDSKYPLALPEGSVLAGQYVIKKVLGQGGFGITYKATDHKTGGFVAVKEYFPDSMATRTKSIVTPFTGERSEYFSYGKECFLKEAETLAQFIGNPNIVRIFSYFEENGTAYFVMEYIEGTSFDEFIKNHGGKISWNDTSRILVPIMDALGAVHSKGIVHRDVAPDNIYITSNGTVKLLDFGAARYSLGDKSRSLDVVLKHGYAPKEQYTRHGKQGPFTDVYALGATFYFALTGKRPPDSIDRIDDEELIPPSSLGVKIPSEAEEAILTALNFQPANRFQTMDAFKNAMLGFGADSPESDAASKTVSSNAGISQVINSVEQRSFTESDFGSSSQNIVKNTPYDGSGMQNSIQNNSFGASNDIQRENPEISRNTGKKKWVIPVIAASLGVVLVIVILVFTLGSGNSSTSDNSQKTSYTDTKDIVKVRCAVCGKTDECIPIAYNGIEKNVCDSCVDEVKAKIEDEKNYNDLVNAVCVASTNEDVLKEIKNEKIGYAVIMGTDSVKIKSIIDEEKCIYSDKEAGKELKKSMESFLPGFEKKYVRESKDSEDYIIFFYSNNFTIYRKVTPAKPFE